MECWQPARYGSTNVPASNLSLLYTEWTPFYGRSPQRPLQRLCLIHGARI